MQYQFNKLRRSAAQAAAAPLILVGWIFGMAEKLLRLAWAAIIAGYERGSKL